MLNGGQFEADSAWVEEKEVRGVLILRVSSLGLYPSFLRPEKEVSTHYREMGRGSLQRSNKKEWVLRDPIGIRHNLALFFH